MTAQERWLGLFDRGRAMSLLLFEHIHGESRDRGQAMVDLIRRTGQGGFELASQRAAGLSAADAGVPGAAAGRGGVDWLSHTRHILELLAARAAERAAAQSRL